jgi:hypothetical protein
MKSHFVSQPDIEGPAGRAWLCEQEKCEKDNKTGKDLAIYVLDTCGEKYSVVCVHQSGDSEESYFDLVVLDDEPCVEYCDPRKIENIRVGLWPEIVEPLNVNNEEQARLIALNAIEKCLEGELEPTIAEQAKWHNFIEDQSLKIAH